MREARVDLRPAILRTAYAPAHHVLDPERHSLRNAAVHDGERPDPHLLDDGRAEFRACQLLYDRRLFRLRDFTSYRLLARLLCRPPACRSPRRADRALWIAAGASFRPHRRTALHLRSCLRSRRTRQYDLGQAARRLSRATLARFRGLPPVRHHLSGLSNLHAGDGGGDVRVPADRAEAHPRRPDHPGRTDPSEHGCYARPRRAHRLHGRFRRRRSPCRTGRRHRRPGARDPALDGRAARTDPVRRHRGRRAGFARRRLRGLAADRPGADLRGRDQRLARRCDRSVRGLRLRRARPRAAGADRARPALSDAGAGAGLQAHRAVRKQRDMSESLRISLAFLALATLFVVAPHLIASGVALTMMSLMGVMIIFALSYNMLLGQTGLLSFGHAVYYGLAGFCAAHAMNLIASNKLPIPLPAIPLVGAVAGLVFGIIFGAISTRRAGTVFSMISLGLGELVAAFALVLHTFFGGEEGIATNRVKLAPFLGYRFGPQIQVYYLIAFWCFVCVVLMYALTRTPFGRMCNAVRDNPERAEFVGYSTQRIRFQTFVLSAMFAGVAGALA